jgi:hypothetical protein
MESRRLCHALRLHAVPAPRTGGRLQLDRVFPATRLDAEGATRGRDPLWRDGQISLDSAMTRKLDVSLAAWRARRLDEQATQYHIIDAHYEQTCRERGKCALDRGALANRRPDRPLPRALGLLARRVRECCDLEPDAQGPYHAWPLGRVLRRERRASRLPGCPPTLLPRGREAARRTMSATTSPRPRTRRARSIT